MAISSAVARFAVRAWRGGMLRGMSEHKILVGSLLRIDSLAGIVEPSHSRRASLKLHVEVKPPKSRDRGGSVFSGLLSRLGCGDMAVRPLLMFFALARLVTERHSAKSTIGGKILLSVTLSTGWRSEADALDFLVALG